MDLTFRISDQVGGAALFEESHVGTALQDGFFRVLLNSENVDPFSDLFRNLPAGVELFLEIAVYGETLSPRQQLSAMP